MFVSFFGSGAKLKESRQLFQVQVLYIHSYIITFTITTRCIIYLFFHLCCCCYIIHVTVSFCAIIRYVYVFGVLYSQKFVVLAKSPCSLSVPYPQIPPI